MEEVFYCKCLSARAAWGGGGKCLTKLCVFVVAVQETAGLVPFSVDSASATAPLASPSSAGMGES